MDLDQLPWSQYIQLHSFIPSQQGDLVKIPSCCIDTSPHYLDPVPAHSLTWWLIITISSSFPPPCFNCPINQPIKPTLFPHTLLASLLSAHHLTAVIIAVTSTNHNPVTWILTKVTPLFFMMSLPLPGVRTIIGDGEMMTRGAAHRPRWRQRRLIPRWLMMDGIRGEMMNRVIYYWILMTTRKYSFFVILASTIWSRNSCSWTIWSRTINNLEEYSK